MYNFKKNKFCIVRKAVDKNIINFVYNYFLIKEQIAKTLFDTKYISPFNQDFGVFNDGQVEGAYAHYADVAMETLLLMLHSTVEKETNLKLNPSYSYARNYRTGAVLKKHIDRSQCEISTTMNLGGDSWSIFLISKKKKVQVDLKPGDMLIYKGCELKHWRDKFKGDHCAQVFLHYNNIKSKVNIYDNRRHVGLPNFFKLNNI